MVPLQILKNTCIVGLCVLFFLAQFSCATHTVSNGTPLRDQLGRIGVVSAQYTPAVEFALPAKGWLGGAARGAAEGTKAFIILVPSGAVMGGVGTLMAIAGGPEGFLVGLYGIALLLKGAGYMIVGPFYGAATAEAPKTVEEAEVQLRTALASLRIQETMRTQVVQQAASVQSTRPLIVLEGEGPQTPSDLLTYFPLQDTNIDTVLELRVTRLWLSTEKSFLKPFKEIGPKPSEQLKINPPLSLGLEVRSRLIRTADKIVLYDKTWKQESKTHLFSEWAANEAKLFAEELDRHYKYLAGQIVRQIF